MQDFNQQLPLHRTPPIQPYNLYSLLINYAPFIVPQLLFKKQRVTSECMGIEDKPAPLPPSRDAEREPLTRITSFSKLELVLKIIKQVIYV